MKSTKKSKNTKGVTYGSVSLPDNAFDPKETKFRVTMFMDLDVLDLIRKKAKERGLPYQTFINQSLRDLFVGDQMDSHIREIVRQELKKTGT